MTYDTQNVFAKILRGELPAFKIYEDQDTMAMMDIMPQTRGHVLVLTKEPAATFFNLSPEGAAACIRTAKKIAPVLQAVTGAQGLMLEQFNHACAGQTVFHVHFHLIPRYEGQALNIHAREMGDQADIAALAQALQQALQQTP